MHVFQDLVLMDLAARGLEHDLGGEILFELAVDWEFYVLVLLRCLKQISIEHLYHWITVVFNGVLECVDVELDARVLLDPENLVDLLVVLEF